MPFLWKFSGRWSPVTLCYCRRPGGKTFVIRLVDVEQCFGSNVYGLRGVNLHVNTGEAVAVLGPSGSGKTTLMDILGVLRRPSGGQYFFQGSDVTRFGDADLTRLRRFAFGYIFQSYNLILDWSVKKNLQLALRHHGVLRDEALSHALASIGLGGKLEARVSGLSGGEQQRVAILRAVLRNPQIILADEPTGNLDAATAGNVLSMLLDLWKTGKTLIMITHSEALAAFFPRVMRLCDGRIVEDSDTGGRKDDFAT